MCHDNYQTGSMPIVTTLTTPSLPTRIVYGLPLALFHLCFSENVDLNSGH